MNRVNFWGFCIAALFMYGMSELSFGESDDDLGCLWEQDATCSDVTETSCSHFCQEVDRPSGGKRYQCLKEGGTYNVFEPVFKKNKYSTTVESDEGFCDPGPEQSTVYCASVYYCTGSCNERKVGDDCDNLSFHKDAGRKVRPEKADQSKQCPSACWESDDEDVDLDGPP